MFLTLGLRNLESLQYLIICCNLRQSHETSIYEDIQVLKYIFSWSAQTMILYKIILAADAASQTMTSCEDKEKENIT